MLCTSFRSQENIANDYVLLFIYIYIYISNDKLNRKNFVNKQS